MLVRHVLVRLTAVAALVTAGAVVAAPAWSAPPPPGGEKVVCPPRQGPCTVEVDKPARPATRKPAVRQAGSAGERACSSGPAREVVPCQVPMFGSWSQQDECYYQLVSPQPAKSDPLWQGHTDGGIYLATCPGVLGTGGGVTWRPGPAPGGGPAPVVTAAELAQRAVRLLPIRGPDIGMAPRPGSTGLVGLPVWMWTAVSAETWGPVSRTASVPGLSVTATARAARIVWDMGDGARVTCEGPGTRYVPAYGDRMSPTCGHRYTRSSARQPRAVYRVTATTTWEVTWAGGGDAGALTVTRESSGAARIGELQVLVQGTRNT